MTLCGNSGVARFLEALVQTFIGGHQLKQKISKINMNIGRVTGNRNTSQLFIGIGNRHKTLLKIVRGRVSKALEWRRRQEWGLWRDMPLSSGGGVRGLEEI